MMGFPFCSLIHLTGMGECDFINDLFFSASMYYRHLVTLNSGISTMGWICFIDEATHVRRKYIKHSHPTKFEL